jgi:hypothetical protein
MRSLGIPRRFAQYAKDLQRAGMNIVVEAKQESIGSDAMSEKAVEKVTDVVDKVDGIGAKAEKVATHFGETLDELDETLDIAQDMSNSLRRVGSTLRGKLGIQTNRPPAKGLPAVNPAQETGGKGEV